MLELPEEVLELQWEPMTAALLQTIYKGDGFEERSDALDTGFQWYSTLRSPAPKWVRSLLPLLSNESDPLVRELLLYLSLYSTELARSGSDLSEEALAMSDAIRGGYSNYLKLFHVDPVSTGSLLTVCPERAKEYLALLLSDYDAEQDSSNKVGKLLTLARVASALPGWRDRLADGLQSESQELRFVCGMEMIMLDGDHTSTATVDEVVHAWSGLKSILPFIQCMNRALPKLSKDRQVAVLVRILEEGKSTDQCQLVCKFLLEAAYGRFGVVGDFPDMSFFKGNRTIEFLWIGPARTHNLQAPTDEDERDWLAALLKKTELWQDNFPGRNRHQLHSNLYELFGLPNDREGLVRLWSAVHGRNWG